MSRREQIRMGAAEVDGFLAAQHTVVCATNGPRGWPHLMPLWYVLRPTQVAAATASSARELPPSSSEQRLQLWAWTYAASQKVRNLERDPHATLQVEDGEAYHELRGVMFECEVQLHRDLPTVAALGREILTRYAGPIPADPEAAVELPAEAGVMIERQAAKRVGLQFHELRRATWDHRKLGGVY